MKIDLLEKVTVIVDGQADNYVELLNKIPRDTQFLFGTSIYVNNLIELCSEHDWLAGYLFANAVQEAEGSRRLVRLGDKAAEKGLRFSNHFLRHAVEEAKHAWIFIDLLYAIYPKVDLQPHLLNELKSSIPVIINDSKENPSSNLPSGEYYDEPPEDFETEFCQINIGEIKSLVHLLVLNTICTKLTPENNLVKNHFEQLIKDEIHHIKYTALQINYFIQNQGLDLINEIYTERLKAFNKVVLNKEHGFLD